MKKKKKSTPKIIRRLDYAFYFFTLVCLIIGSVYIYDIYQDRKLSFVAKDSMELYQDSDLEKGAKIGILPPKVRLQVLRVLYTNDHFAVQIKAANGQTGWILKPDELHLK